MNDAPERIWAVGEEPCPEWEGFWHISPPDTSGMTQYIRADLVPGWKPIETAPKDGKTILVCLPRMMNLIVRASYSNVHKYWRTDLESDGGISRPTFFHTGDHWMPLPAPPK